MGHKHHKDKTICKYKLKNRSGFVDKIFGRGTKGNGIIAFCSGIRAYPLGRRVNR